MAAGNVTSRRSQFRVCSGKNKRERKVCCWVAINDSLQGCRGAPAASNCLFRYIIDVECIRILEKAFIIPFVLSCLHNAHAVTPVKFLLKKTLVRLVWGDELLIQMPEANTELLHGSRASVL